MQFKREFLRIHDYREQCLMRLKKILDESAFLRVYPILCKNSSWTDFELVIDGALSGATYEKATSVEEMEEEARVMLVAQKAGFSAR